MLPWGDLPEALKVSNFHQVVYAENILKTAGLGIRPITDPGKPLVSMTELLGKAGLERLAEMEHGRWNVERLLLGWRWAETKDVGRKLSPYLVPWDKLPPEIQEYDLRCHPQPAAEVPRGRAGGVLSSGACRQLRAEMSQRSMRTSWRPVCIALIVLLHVPAWGLAAGQATGREHRRPG